MSNEAKDDKPQVDIKEAIDALQELQRVLRSTSVTILAVLKRYTTKNPPCCFAYSAIPIGQAVVDLTQGLSMHLPCMLMEAATWEQVKGMSLEERKTWYLEKAEQASTGILAADWITLASLQK